MAASRRSWIQFFVLLSVGVLLVWLSLRQVAPEKERILDAFSSADYLWIVISMLISLLSHLLRAFRWNYLLAPLGYRVNFLNATCYVLVGYLANYGIPRMGEVSRCTLAARYDKVPFEVGLGTVITERLVDFMLFILIFVLTLFLQFSQLIGLANQLVFDKLPRGTGPYIVAGAAFLAIAVCWLFRKKITSLLKGRLGAIAKGLASGIASIARMKRPVAFIALSLLIWVCYFYSLYACFFALKATSVLGHRECLTLLLFGTLGVIFSPGGLGAYPAILGGILLYTYNMPMADAFALPWLSWTSQFILIIFVGSAALIVLPIYNKRRNELSQPANA